MIWFTSDSHYNHKNIVRGTTQWQVEADRLQRLRDFDTLEDHNNKLVENFNRLVKEDDTLYHLGDWSFGGFQAIREFRQRLNCKNIHLVFGNHDHHIEANKDGIQDIFSSTNHYLEVSVHGQRIVMSHYAMRVWNKSHHQSWMLFGHSHGSLKDKTYDGKFRTMDVGVDTNNLKPYSYTELHDLFKNRPALLGIDHHARNTN